MPVHIAATRAGRPPMPGITPIDEGRIFYCVLWPMTFMSIHPDYLLLHRLIPEGPDRTQVVCDWLFDVELVGGRALLRPAGLGPCVRPEGRRPPCRRSELCCAHDGVGAPDPRNHRASARAKAAAPG